MFKMFQYGNNTIANIRAWFRASLCNANQVSTCGCWPRKLEVRQLEINWKNIRKPCLLKESAMNVVGWMLEPLHDKRASRAVRRNINNVSVGFLYWYLPTPHFRPLHKLPKKDGFFARSKVPTPPGNPPWTQLKPREHVHVEGMWPPPSCARLPEVVPSHAPVKQFVCPTDGGLKLQMGCNISSMSSSEKKRLSGCSFFSFHVRFCHCNGPLARSMILQISPLKLREFQTWSWPPHPHQLDLAGLKFEV